jgi:zinc D-Ala-D-Ala carboxypeptidase
MPKSMRQRRRATFVFGPPAIMLVAGLVMTLTPLGASSENLNRGQQLLEATLTSLESSPELGTPQQILAAMNETLEFNRQTRLLGVNPWALNDAKDTAVILNKQRPLNPIDYTPETLVTLPTTEFFDNARELRLAKPAADALLELAREMHSEGAGRLFLNSGYRSYDYQRQLFESKTEQYGLEGALIRSAKAGLVLAVTGLAADVSVTAQGCAIMNCFGETVAGKWLAENAWKHGYVVRYKEGFTEITGFTYEPWHLRYVGKPIARALKQSGYHTLEQFWRLPAAPTY